MIAKSVCPLDCPDTCALELTIADGRLVKLDGQREHPVTRGFACVKMSHYPARQHHPDRLHTPLRRVGAKGMGQFAPITWEAALEEIAQRLTGILSQYGPRSILPYHYAGTMGLIERDHPVSFFRGLGACELDQTICATTGATAWDFNYGPGRSSTPLESLPHSRTIILWGINALRSNSHLAPWINQARRAGAHVLHIDPYRNETSRFADDYWQIKVGTDAALALSLGHEIFKLGGQDTEYLVQHAHGAEEYRHACAEWPADRAAEFCGLNAKEIRDLAQRICEKPPLFIKVGYGLTRNEGGGNAMRAITLLPALVGAWKQIGGGAGLSTSGAYMLNKSRYSGAHLLKPDRRHVNQNHLGRVLADQKDPIQALFVFNSNPMAVSPDTTSVAKGLSREDLFTVVLEHFQTDTADYADILLPATTFLEHADIYTSYGHYYLQWAEPLLAPLGQCRPNSWVFQQLAKRMGLTDEVFSWSAEEIARDLLDTHEPTLAGITFERLQRERSIRLNLPDDYRPYHNGSQHADRKVRFAPPPAQLNFVEQPTLEYPYRLISPPGAFVLNSSMGNIQELLKAAGGEPQVLMHPEDANQCGLSDGDYAFLTSRHGQITRKVKVTSDARLGTVIAVGLWWPKLAPDKKGLNVLTSQELTDLGAGSLFGNTMIGVQRVES
ncbi:MAG: molybdopterin-dependent oxidoreductase [Pirellulaceae bacterium]|nr:molybdopterin-dependent oxidoreductase [Pirellulaceae bacterium]